MSEITRQNHFVPQFYLRQWVNGTSKLWSYRTLVPNENVPLWSHASPRTVAARMDLYTEIVEGEEVDEFERWVKSEFEDPAAQVINKLRDGAALAGEDWARLGLFFAAQDVRTPTSLIDSLRRWRKELPDLIDKTLRESVDQLERAKREGVVLEVPDTPHPLSWPMRVDIDPDAEAPPGMVQIRAEVTPGRRLWLDSIRHLLTGVAAILAKHHWSLVEAPNGIEWVTSDHPTMRLNYNSPTDFTFKGGWGSPGSDLIMPVSPRYLLFTQVGKEYDRHIQFSPDQAREVQRLLCLRAHREIFVRAKDPSVPSFRPRIVDVDMVRHEEDEWANWHQVQSDVERDLEADDGTS